MLVRRDDQVGFSVVLVREEVSRCQRRLLLTDFEHPVPIPCRPSHHLPQHPLIHPVPYPVRQMDVRIGGTKLMLQIKDMRGEGTLP